MLVSKFCHVAKVNSLSGNCLPPHVRERDEGKLKLKTNNCFTLNLNVKVKCTPHFYKLFKSEGNREKEGTSFNVAYSNTIVCKLFFLPHELITWLSALKGIIAAFCSANIVCDENNSTFSSVILPTDRCISYRFLSAHSKSDTDEVAL